MHCGFEFEFEVIRSGIVLLAVFTRFCRKRSIPHLQILHWRHKNNGYWPYVFEPSRFFPKGKMGRKYKHQACNCPIKKKSGNVRRHNASAGLSSLQTASASMIPSTSVSNQLHFHVFLTSLSMDFICPGSTLSRSMISFLLDVILTDVRRRIVQ